jgi:hypothetical protein
MLQKRFDLLDPETPVVFADGTEVYKELAKTYKTHRKGYYIIAPSGAGKTYFIDNQKQKNWIDGDVLWMTAKAHPEGEWWLEPSSIINEIERRSDVITAEAKKLGFWIIGTDSFATIPDAVVIPHWSTHKKYILLREIGHYDGGATSEDFAQVLQSRRWMASFARKGVPLFRTIKEAATFLAAQ